MPPTIGQAAAAAHRLHTLTTVAERERNPEYSFRSLLYSLYIHIYIYVHAAQPRQLRESPSPKCRVPKIRRSQHDCTARGVSVRQPTGYVPALGCAWLRKVAGQPGSSARPRGFFGRGSPTGMAAMTRSETSTAPARPAAARGGTSHEAGSMARSRGCACPAAGREIDPTV